MKRRHFVHRFLLVAAICAAGCGDSPTGPARSPAGNGPSSPPPPRSGQTPTTVIVTDGWSGAPVEGATVVAEA
jgi:hypothetical protein